MRTTDLPTVTDYEDLVGALGGCWATTHMMVEVYAAFAAASAVQFAAELLTKRSSARATGAVGDGGRRRQVRAVQRHTYRCNIQAHLANSFPFSHAYFSSTPFANNFFPKSSEAEGTSTSIKDGH